MKTPFALFPGAIAQEATRKRLDKLTAAADEGARIDEIAIRNRAGRSARRRSMEA